MNFKIAQSIRQNVLSLIHKKKIEVDVPLPIKDIDTDIIKTPLQVGNRIIQLYALIALTDPKAKKSKIQNWLISGGFFDSLEEEEKNLFIQKSKTKTISKMALSWL